MSSKIKTKSELKRVIRSMIDEGHSREEVFEQLRTRYSSEHALAVMVGENPEQELRKKNKLYSYGLGVVMLALAGVVFALDLVKMGGTTGEATGQPAIDYTTAVILPGILIALAILSFWFIPIGIRMSTFVGYGSALYVFYLMSVASPVDDPDQAVLVLAISGLLMSGLTIALAAFLKRRIMPGYSLMGPPRDSEGKYRFR